MAARRQSEVKETRAYHKSKNFRDLSLFQCAKVFGCSLLGHGPTFDSVLMINIVFPEIGAKLAEERPQQGLKNVDRRRDRASCHNSGQATEIKQLGLSRLPYPSYSPGISPRGFWLVAFLKDDVKAIQQKAANRSWMPLRRFWPKFKEVIVFRCIKIGLKS
jgi:hypothetical protein